MANPFNKKTWQKRLTQYPTRRTLTDPVSGTEQTVDISRAEGQVYAAGDGFTTQNMNDLEERIEDAFDNVGSDMTHTVPRAIPKDITEYYQDGTLWDRISGTRGFEYREDVYVGDYFQMSRPITCKNLKSSGATSTPSQYVAIASFGAPFGMFGVENAILCIPISIMIASSGIYAVGHFGISSWASSASELQANGLQEFNEYVLGHNDDAASTQTDATIMAQLKAEFGSHLGIEGERYTPKSYDSSYNVTSWGLDGTFYTDSSSIALLTDLNVFGFSIFDDLYTKANNIVKLSAYYRPFEKQLDIFRHGLNGSVGCHLNVLDKGLNIRLNSGPQMEFLPVNSDTFLLLDIGVTPVFALNKEW